MSISGSAGGGKWVLRASLLNRNAFLHWKIKEVERLDDWLSRFLWCPAPLQLSFRDMINAGARC